MDVLLVISIGLLLPIIHLPLRIRLALWIFLALFPLYMFHKSMFVNIVFFGSNLQVPTLTKDFVCLICLIVVFIYFITQYINGQPFPHKNLLIFLSILTFFLIATGLIQGNGLGQTIMGVRVYVFYTVAGLLFGSFLLQTGDDIRCFTSILLGAIIVIAIIGMIHQYLDPYFLILESFEQPWGGRFFRFKIFEDRLRSYFTAANVLGHFMSLGIVVAFWKMLASNRNLGKIIALGFCMIIFFWVMILTLSRSSILVTGVACIFLNLVVAGRIPKVPILFATLGFAALILLTPMAERFQNLYNNPRLLIWAIFIRASISSMRYLLMGHGVGSIGRFGAEYSMAADIKDPKLAFLQGGIGEKGETFVVDNFFVRILYEIGISGFILTAVLFAFFLIAFWRTYRSADAQQRLMNAMPLTIMALVFMLSIFGDSLGTYPWSFFFWLSFSCLYHRVFPAQTAAAAR